MTKSILFISASGGIAFSTLRRALAAGHRCVVLARDPAKISARLSPAEQAAVRLEQGNAHDGAALQRVLLDTSDSDGASPPKFVDYILSSIGNAVSWDGMRNADYDVCRKGMEVLLGAITTLRTEKGASGRPRVVAVSSTGISDYTRDIPLAMVPLYKVMLAAPHKDKKAMENLLIASDEAWTIVRPSLLTNGVGDKTPVRVGVEAPLAPDSDSNDEKKNKKNKIVSLEIGYTVSREDVGKWIFEKLIEENETRDGETEKGQWVYKIVSVTY